MKNLILVALVLQLVVTIIEINGEYQFGDIIQFPRDCLAPGGEPTYKHYAIYVGPKTVRDIGQGDNDIVHRTGATDKSNCRFDKLENAKGKWKESKSNYLDGIEGFKQGTPEEMTARIKEAMKNCKRYDLFTNNCEHFATFIRYGKGKSLQSGAAGECLININPKAKKLLAEVKAHAKEEARCEKSG